jgi:hypothetical protein
MRFTEIANPEEQLALWKLVSDKMWATFQQQAPQQSSPVAMKQLSASTPKSVAKPLGKRNTKPVKPYKPKKAPVAPAPKPLPKPQPQQPTATQAAKQQNQQHQQIAQHLQKELTKGNPQQRIYPEPPIPTTKPVPFIDPMNDSYDERDKDELVMYSRERNPFKTISQIKSGLSVQKRGILAKNIALC